MNYIVREGNGTEWCVYCKDQIRENQRVVATGPNWRSHLMCWSSIKTRGKCHCKGCDSVIMPGDTVYWVKGAGNWCPSCATGTAVADVPMLVDDGYRSPVPQVPTQAPVEASVIDGVQLEW